MENYLNITQLAHLRNTTTETLRHYDRVGLLKPGYVDANTGYRYYSLDQIEIFDTIMDLKNLGLPLKEIKEFLAMRNVKYSYELLSKKAVELQKEIEEKQKMLLQIQQKTSYIEMINKGNVFSFNEWKVGRIRKRELVVSKMPEENIHDFIYEFTRLRANLEENFNMFGTNISGSVISPQSFMDLNRKRLERYPALPYGICREELKYGELIELPENDYLTCYGKGILVAGDANIQKIHKYLEENGYEIAGYIYEKDIIDIPLTNDQTEIIFQLEIPVKKIKKI